MRHDVNARILSIMGRMAIQPSPTNYELIHEIITGNNPVLRDRFMQLGTMPKAAELQKLAEEFLPHHFSQALGDRSVTVLKAELEQLVGSLARVQQDFDAYSSILDSTTQKIDTADGDRNAIRTHLRELNEATVRQRENNTSLAANVQQRLAAINTVSVQLDEAERIKFTHAATGLQNRRAFNKKLAEKFGSGKMLEEASIIFAQIGNFRIFETGNLIKIKMQVLAHIGAVLHKSLPAEIFTAWIDTPHLAVIAGTTRRAEIERLAAMMASALQPVLEDIHRRLPNYLPLTIAFGACDAYNAFSLADMLEKTEKALMEAEKYPSGSLVIFDPADRSDGQRHNYALYQSVSDPKKITH